MLGSLAIIVHDEIAAHKTVVSALKGTNARFFRENPDAWGLLQDEGGGNN